MNDSVVKACGACSEHNDPYNDHFHNDFELLFMEKGAAKIKISKKEYDLKEGDVVFIGMLEQHSIKTLTKTYKYRYIIIDSKRLEKVIYEPRLASVFRNRLPGFSHVVSMGQSCEETLGHFKRIEKELLKKDIYYDVAVRSCLIEILVDAYRKAPNDFDIEDKNISADVYFIERYLEENFADDIKISELALKHFMSSGYLSKSFKSLTGYTPKQYLCECRISHAKTMLLESKASVQEIAVKCGFNDVNNFIRKFKENTGVTPYKYRTNSK